MPEGCDSSRDRSLQQSDQRILRCESGGRSVQPSLATLAELANAFAVRRARPADRTGVRKRTAVGHDAAAFVLESTVVVVPGDQCGQPGAVGSLAGPSKIGFRSTARLNADANAVALRITVTGGLAGFPLDFPIQLISAGRRARQRCGPAVRSLLRHRGCLRSVGRKRICKDTKSENGVDVIDVHPRIVAQWTRDSYHPKIGRPADQKLKVFHVEKFYK